MMNMNEAISLLSERGITADATEHTWPSGASSETLVLHPVGGGYPYLRVNGLSGGEVRWVYIPHPGQAEYPEPEECIRLFKAHSGAPKCAGSAISGGRCERFAPDILVPGGTSLDDIDCGWCRGPGQQRPNPWAY